MKTISKYIQKLTLLIALFVICGNVAGQKNIITDPNFERKALVAPECVINELVSVVEVVEGEKSLNNLLDTNLTNSTQASSLVGLDLFADPRIRIKDTKNLYPAGTTAGFCLEMGFDLLTVDLLSSLQIWFYKDGVVTEKLFVDQQDAGLLDLNLISIPGENIVSYYTAKSTKQSRIEANNNQTTYQQDLAAAKADWEKAKKGYEALIKDQKATSEQVKKAREEMEAKEKAYKELGGEVNKKKQVKDSSPFPKFEQNYSQDLQKQADAAEEATSDTINDMVQTMLDGLDAEQEAMYKYLRNYGTFREQQQAITEE